MGKTSVSPIAFEFSKPFPLHSCKLHALLSAAYILFACLLELCDDCLTCPKVAKICQELKLGKGIAFIWSSSLITPPLDILPILQIYIFNQCVEQSFTCSFTLHRWSLTHAHTLSPEVSFSQTCSRYNPPSLS